MVSNVPALVPHLQRQQGSLRYLCEAAALTEAEKLAPALKQFYKDVNRIAEVIGEIRQAGQAVHKKTLARHALRQARLVSVPTSKSGPECLTGWRMISQKLILN